MKRFNQTAAVAFLLALYQATTASADPALREQRDVEGDFVIIGNTLAHECQAGGMPPVPAPVVGDVGDCPNGNDFAPDIYWRADEPGALEALADEAITPAEARSTAVLLLPEEADVVYARLYWAALSDSASPDGTVRVQRPSSSLDTEVTADDGFEVEDQNDPDNIWYHSTADVTALVQAQGIGQYRIADVGSVNIVNLGSENAVVAWAMVVVYENPGDPPRNIAIFDGLDLVTEEIGSAEATLEGFLVPNAGFDAKLGVITYEGEAQFTGDSLLFNDTALSNGFNPMNNFFNATRTRLGAVESNVGDLPQLTGGPRSLSNLDLDVMDVTSLVNEGDTSATIEATSTLDTFLLGAFVTSISTFKPEFVSSTKEVIDDNGGAIRPGDELLYRINVRNTGSDVSIDTVLTDALPDGVTYVANSTAIVSGPNEGEKTDESGDDEVTYDEATNTVTVNLGDGATSSMGGELRIGEETVVTLRVTVDADAEGVIENQAIITAQGEQGAPSEDTVTDGNGQGAGQPPTVIVIDGCDTDDDCDDPTPFCDIATSPRICVECTTSAQCEDPAKPDCGFDTNVCECASDDCSEDSDDDGISDSAEDELGTDPNDADTDDDGVADGSELAPDEDSDSDGLINALDADSDNDALFDGTELGLGCGADGIDASAGHCRADADMGETTTNPLAADTDGGGASDGSEDFDRDGAIDGGETDPTVGHGDDDDEVTDADGDGLSDGLEDELHSDSDDADSDDDGVPDGEEPNPADDVDGDGLPSVLDVDSDNDGLYDGTELGKNCMGDGTEVTEDHCRADNDGGATTTSALDPDTDGGGVRDGSEDSNLNGVVDAGETDPVAGQGDDDEDIEDTDGDGLSDALEEELETDAGDADSDDDGVPDGQEPNPSDDHDGDGEINALDPDSDNDGLFDGTEVGNDCSSPAIEEAMNCIADGDGGDTTTSAVNADTDYGGKRDGDEDADKDGVVDDGETDPLDPRDDSVGEACETDSDCGGAESGIICDDDTCDFGCRGEGGNGCPDGEECSSTTDEPGTCEDTTPPTDGGVTGGTDGGAGDDGGMTGGSGGMSGGEGGASGASATAIGVLGGGGCDCRAVPGQSRSSEALLILAALALLWTRRRTS